MTSYTTTAERPAPHEAGNGRKPLIAISDLKVHFDLGPEKRGGKYLLGILISLAFIPLGALAGFVIGAGSLMGGLAGYYVATRIGRRSPTSTKLGRSSVSPVALIVGTLAGLIIGQVVGFITILLAVILAQAIFGGAGLLPAIAGIAGIIVGSFAGYFLGGRVALLVIGSPARKAVRAVDGVTLNIYPGETLGLVGESGCGKSTLGRAILRLTEPTSGQVLFRNQDLAHLSTKAMREQRRHLQIIFQDPYASLNPRMTVAQIVGEPLRTFRLVRGKAAIDRVQQLMETVGLSRRFVKRYPHEFSGGQRQRIGIARALAVDPDFIVADEPISALDVSIQAQIMNLLEQLQVQKSLTYLFISHDLRAIRHVSDRIAVMYLGKLVEVAAAENVYADPLMPYTKALISAVPVPDPIIEAARKRIVLQGDVPSPINPPPGCRFHTRCPYAIQACREVEPPLVEIKPDHFAACIRISPEQPDIDQVNPGEAPGLGQAPRGDAA